jgi:hypothetical protein
MRIIFDQIPLAARREGFCMLPKTGGSAPLTPAKETFEKSFLGTFKTFWEIYRLNL